MDFEKWASIIPHLLRPEPDQQVFAVRFPVQPSLPSGAQGVQLSVEVRHAPADKKVLH